MQATCFWRSFLSFFFEGLKKVPKEEFEQTYLYEVLRKKSEAGLLTQKLSELELDELELAEKLNQR